jgi:ATP-dependent RNA helicase DDX5/DBP2
VVQAGTNGLSNGAAPYANGHAKHVLPASEQSFALTAEQYRAEHGLVVQGDRVPDPLQTFESAGFSSNIMDEVLYNRLTCAWSVTVA